jgi:two-component system, cell cycle sensor histidine kinase and response regulator CckA
MKEESDIIALKKELRTLRRRVVDLEKSNAANDVRRRGIEEALLRAEENFRRSLDDSPLGVRIVTLKGKTIYANQAILDIYGYRSIEELRATPLRKRYTSESFAEAQKRKEKRIHCDDGPSEYEVSIKRKDGEIRLLQVFRKEVLWDGKKQFQVVYHDITNRKRAEEELFKVKNLESIGTLAGGIAHDFNNLLAVVLGYIELTKAHTQPGIKSYLNLEKAEKACVKASSLTKRLITFSRAGEPQRAVISLTKMLTESVEILLRGSNVRCSLSLPDNLWSASVDEGQIKQVVHHLMMNACESMPGGGEIVIKAVNRTVIEGDELPLMKGKYIQLSVTDHGKGIPRENLSKIFDPYFTSKARDSSKGMGLGLAICYSIVKSHNGFISAVSEVGLGSTFTVYLPVFLSGDAVQKIREKPPEIRVAVKDVCGKKGKILVMDDEAPVRDMMENILKQLNYDVEAVESETEAIALYKKEAKSKKPFTAVVLDLTVRGGSGGEWVVRKLFQINPGLKAIVASGYADDPVITGYQAYGFKGAIVKPFTMQELETVLNKTILS